MWYGIIIGLLIASNWLWWVFYTAYRKEMLKQIRKRGYDQYAYTNDWWIINRDAPHDNRRVAGPFSSAQDAAKGREILERTNTLDLNYWVQRIDDSAEVMEIDHVQPVSKAFNKIRGGNEKSS